MRLLLVLFVVVPLSELYMLLWVSRLIGFWPTVGITLVTGLIGGSLAKQEGLRVWRQWNEALEQFRSPETGIVEGLLVLVGGVLLITPGVMTDVLGFALLIPATRKPLARALKSRVKTISPPASGFRPFHPGGPPPRGAARGEFRVVDTSGETREE